MRSGRRVFFTALIAVCGIAATAEGAFAASSISVGVPRKIGVQQEFTMSVSGFGDPAPLNHPQATVRVLVGGTNTTYIDPCSVTNTVNDNPGIGTVFAGGTVPAGSFSITTKTKFPQVGNWHLCATVSSDRFTNQNAFARTKATATVTHKRVVIKEKAVDVSFSPGTVQADGTNLSVATVLATEGFNGIPNASLAIQPDPKPAAPRAVICDTRGGGKLLWPGSRFQDGTRSVSGFDTKADGGGSKSLKILSGSQGGSFSLSGTLKSQASIFDIQNLTLNAAGLGGFPADPRAFLTQLGHDYMEGSAPRFAAGLALRDATGRTTLARQQAILEWLGFVHPPGVGFGPARRSDGRAGVVLYPKGTNVRTAAGALTPGSPRWVIDVDNLGTAIANSSTVGGIFRFPDLSNPQFAGAVLPLTDWTGGGFAVAGFAEAKPNEDLAYFGYPEPPPIGAPGRNDFEGCLGLGIGGYLADVHSPARLVFKTPAGAQLGVGPSGALVDVPGGFVSAPARGVARYHVPTGSYSVGVSGTGRGKVTLVLAGPGGAQPSVFSFSARAGATGTLAVSGGGPPASMKFAGRTVRASRGVGLRISGLPRSLKAGRIATLRLRVRDQFGVAVVGASVAAGSATGATNAQGRAALRVKPRRGRLKVVVGAPGHRSARASVRVK